MRKLTLVLGVPAVVYAILALIPVDRSNPPATSPLAAPAGTAAILERACYDCHSNATRWPWYSYLPPVSWVVAHDVKEGREHLNFSTWGSYSPDDRAGLMREAVEEVEKGAMPMPAYVRLHPEARLSPADVEVLRAWTGGTASPPGGGAEEHGRDSQEDD